MENSAAITVGGFTKDGIRKEHTSARNNLTGGFVIKKQNLPCADQLKLAARSCAHAPMSRETVDEMQR
jgi:hypothetical protein